MNKKINSETSNLETSVTLVVYGWVYIYVQSSQGEHRNSNHRHVLRAEHDG